MKKSFIIVLLAYGLVGQAQENKFRVGIKAGLTMPTISANGDAEAYDGPGPPEYKMNTSFYIAGIASFPVSSLFSIQSGLTLVDKGAKYSRYFNFGTGQSFYEGKVNLMYFEIPLNGIFSFDIGNGKIFFGGGPYYSIAVGGRNKFDFTITENGTTTITSRDDKIKYGADKDFQRNDFGLNLLAGFELYNGLNINIGYGAGLKTITGSSIKYFKEKNKVLSVGFGFYL